MKPPGNPAKPFAKASKITETFHADNITLLLLNEKN